MKAKMIIPVLLVVFLSVMSTNAEAYGRRFYARHCAPVYCRERVFVAPPPIYRPPVVYYVGPRYCPPPRVYARAYWGRPHYHGHRY